MEHLVALVPRQRAPHTGRQLGEGLDEAIADGLCRVVARKSHQQCEPHLAFDQCRDRGLMAGTDDEIALPMPGLSPRLHGRRPVVNGRHVGGLLRSTLASSAAAATVSISAASTQVRRPGSDYQTPVDRFADRFGTDMPTGVAPVTTKPPADLSG